MSRWFRFYDDALNNPKAQRLPGDLFKAWVNLLCLASKHRGVLPALADIAFHLRCAEGRAAAIVARLTALRLFDVEGERVRPHDWSEHQYESDTSTARTRRFRERQRERSGDVTVTAPDTETEAEQTHTQAGAGAPRDVRADFDRFWKVYPRRDGANPEYPARKAFDGLVTGGTDPEVIVAAALAYAQAERERVGTRYIATAVRWLRESRFKDYRPGPVRAPPPGQVWFHRDDPRFVEWDRYLLVTKGAGSPTDGRGGWHFPSERPPDDNRATSSAKQMPLALPPVAVSGGGRR